MHNDSRTLRDRVAALDDAWDNSTAGDDPDCAAAFVGMTTTVATYPTSPSAAYAVHPVEVSGDEAEGSSPSYAQDTGTVAFAINLGSGIPPGGTLVVCHSVGGRWAFRYDSTS